MKKLDLVLIGFAALGLQLFANDLIAQVSFAPAVAFATSSGSQSAISADFNGDNKADLAVANAGANNVSILLGNGTGGFNAATNFAVGSFPYSIISADFNEDNVPDFATANLTSADVTIRLGNGSGGFLGATNYGAGTDVNCIISNDFNTDGHSDLAVTNFSSNTVSILMGNGGGGFSAAISFGAGSGPRGLTSGDFNGDGKMDIVTANQSSNNVSLLLGDGAGNFDTGIDFSVTGSPGSVINADFNGDGNADIATANQSSNKVSILIGNGGGSFAAATNFIVGNYADFIAIADFNIDGKVDLAVVNQNSNDVSVLLGNGNGSFGAATNISVGTNPHSITSSDFNGDGKADLAIPDYGDSDVSILLNNFTPSGPPICLVTVDSSLSHNLLVWEKTNLNLSAIDSFIVYREVTSNNYQAIGAVSKDSLSVFNDLDANPATTGYRYKLKSKDTAGVESQFSDYHNSIYLTNTGANFNWTPYQVENNLTPISTYNVYRDDNSTGVFNLIGNTTGNQFGYTDVQFSSFQNASYYVEAVLAGGACNPTRSSIAASRSNLKHTGTTGIQQFNSISAIKIYPNPANNILSITGISEKTILKMYDIGGKLVLEKEVESGTSINISTLAEGVYTLLTESKTGRAFHKVVVNH